jgi:hypothetical protein
MTPVNIIGSSIVIIVSTAANRILQNCYKNLSNDNKVITSGTHSHYYNSTINKKFTTIITKVMIISLISIMIKVILSSILSSS